jgi:NitT/TauT family transport system substrate-binding protein
MLGLYEKYGLKAAITIFNGDADAAAAVVSGSVDMGSVGASAAMNSQLTDRPAKVITIAKAKVIDGLFCGKDIKTAADLKGKSVAASTLGGTAHASILLALEALKLQPNDVVVQAVGGQSARIAALKGGSVACAPIGMEIKPDLDALGMNLLVDISQTGLEWPSAGIGATADFLAKNPNTALAVAAAQLEAQNYMWTEPDKAAEQWAQFAQIDKARALELINNVPDQLSRTLRWGDSAFPFVQRVLAIVSPGIMTVDAKAAQDRSFLQRLEELGFYQKLGIPLS